MGARIVISGYYGFDNGGDEAVLASITEALRELQPDCRLLVLSHQPEKTARDFGVEAVNRWQFFAVVNAIMRADLLISGGGSLLQDVTGTKSLLYYLGVMKIAQVLGVPSFFYSQGIGPVNGTLGRKLIPFVANKAVGLTVRDKFSKQLLADLGVEQEISVTADPVLGLVKDSIGLDQGAQLLAREGVNPDQPVIGLALREWPGIQLLRPLLVKWCQDMVQNGWQVVFIPFHLPADREFGKSWLEGTKDQEWLTVLRGGYPTRELLSLVGNLDFLVGVRLHALIMAAVMEVPMGGLSYDPKVDAFLEQADQPVLARLDRSLDEGRFILLLNDCFQRRDLLRKKLQERVPGLREQAKEAAQLALAILGDTSKEK